VTAGAAEETDRRAARYVMLTEAIGLSLKGGDIERSVRAAQEIDHAFEQKAKLVRRGGVVQVPFAGGRIVERFSIVGDKLMVERYDPSATSLIDRNNKGEGVREK
jgi:hypothetical protein